MLRFATAQESVVCLAIPPASQRGAASSGRDGAEVVLGSIYPNPCRLYDVRHHVSLAAKATSKATAS